MALINITVVSERSAVLPWKISSALSEKRVSVNITTKRFYP